MTKHIKFLENQNRDLDVLRNEIRNMAMRLMDLSSGNNGPTNGNAVNPQNSPSHPPQQQQQQMPMFPGQPHPGMMHHPAGMGMAMPGYNMPPQQQQHQPLHRPHHSMDFEEDAVIGGVGSADEDELDDDDDDDLMHTPGHNNSHYHQHHQQQQMNLHQMQQRQQGNKGGSNVYYENDFDSVHSGAAYSVNSSIDSLPISVVHGNANNNNTSQKMGVSSGTTGGGGGKKKKVKKAVVTSATRYTNENSANIGAVGGASVTLPRI